MKKLLRYIKEYRKECILAPLFKLFEAFLELLVPIVVASIIDRGIAAGNDGYIMKMCAVLVILAAVGPASSLTAQFFAAKAATGFVANIRTSLFSHIMNFSHSELDELGTSTLITRMTSDINQVQTGVNLTLRLLLRSPFVVFGAMIMAFLVDVKSALIFAVVIPVLLLTVLFIMIKSLPLFDNVQKKLDGVLETARENLIGVRVIRAFCMEKSETEKFQSQNDFLTAASKRAGKISQIMNPLTYTIINVALIFLIKTGALRVNSGLLTKGAVVALYNYMAQILTELIKLADLVINISKSITCGNRIQKVFEVSPEIKSGTSSGKKSEYSVEFNNVSLSYGKTQEFALSQICVKVKHGECVGIIGGTGSGKSSLVNLIPRFYDATCGEVLVCGENVKNYDIAALRSKIAVVLQKAVLFSGTVRENMLWGNEDATDDEIWEALKMAAADDFIRKNPEALDYSVEQNGKNFSGGQRQRLTIARAFLKKSEILILDDSFSALDFATEAILKKNTATLSQTVFIVSQRVSSIMHADKIIVLDEGKLAGLGTHEELLENCGVYREIYTSQTKGGDENEG